MAVPGRTVRGQPSLSTSSWTATADLSKAACSSTVSSISKTLVAVNALVGGMVGQEPPTPLFGERPLIVLSGGLTTASWADLPVDEFIAAPATSLGGSVAMSVPRSVRVREVGAPCRAATIAPPSIRTGQEIRMAADLKLPAALLELPAALLALLREPSLSFIATTMPDGSPQLTQVWVDTDGEHVVVNSVKTHVKVRNIERDPRVALTIADPADPSNYYQVRGQVLQMTTDGAVEHIEMLSWKYLGTPYPWYGGRDQIRVILVIGAQHVSAMR